MKNYFLISLLSVILTITSCSLKRKNEKKKPNIIYILADDLGYGELGSYGQLKIETPNLDKLALNGLRFTQHYSGAPVSAPSRCALLTGRHMGNSAVRGNDEWSERGDVWNFRKVIEDPALEGQRPLPEGTKTIGHYLQTAGYKTGMVGKWGLGAPLSNSTPNNMGFDFFYGYNCQRQAHTYYPKHLWKNNKKVILNNKIVPPGTKLSPEADPYDRNSYSDFELTDYAPELMHKEALKFISENKDSSFFLYYASPIPHVPLQAPKHWVDYYLKKFGDEKPYDGKKGYFPCRYPRATYAAMISYLDEQVGELMEELKRLGLYDNTIILFSSDNGPTYNGGSDSPWFNSGGPFKSEYGWGKGFLNEGGIRVPMIASWPDKISEGSTTDYISAFWDVLPTLCEIADVKISDNTDGTSFLPILLNSEQEQPEYIYYEYPEYGGQQSVRIGDWKAIRKDIKKGNLEIQLFNLKSDIQETTDIADEHPDIINRVNFIMKKEHTKSEVKRFQMKAIGD